MQVDKKELGNDVKAVEIDEEHIAKVIKNPIKVFKFIEIFVVIFASIR